MKKLLFPILSLALFSYSCSRKCGEVNEPELSYKIKSGQRIEFQLKACRNCGLDWQWMNFSNDHLKKVSDDGIICDKGMFNMGSIIRTFVFEGTKQGSDSIVLYLKRPSEPDTITPTERRVVYVNIE